MSKILLIGKNDTFLQKCAERLRWRGYKVMVHEDVMDGLREMMIFSVSCVVWDVEAREASLLKKYKAIQRYHRLTPVFIINQDQDAFGDEIDPDTHFIPEKPSVEALVQKVIELAQVQIQSTDDDEFEEYEKEIGFIE